MEYVRLDHERPLILSAPNIELVMWCVDASFVVPVHPNMLGYWCGGLPIGHVFPIDSPQNRSSTGVQLKASWVVLMT